MIHPVMRNELFPFNNQAQYYIGLFSPQLLEVLTMLTKDSVPISEYVANGAAHDFFNQPTYFLQRFALMR